MPPRTKETNIKKGDRIQAKWSGSNIYYDATVLETGTKLCRVLFEDGSVHSVKPSDIKSPPKPRSTSRTRSTRGRSRSSSAGRKLAPSRSRSRSPARKSKSKTPTSKEKKTPPSKTEKDSNSLTEKLHDKEVTITVTKNFSSSISTETSNDKKYFSKKEMVSEKQEKDPKPLSDAEDPDKGFLKNISASLRTSARIAAVQMAKTKAQETEPVPKTNAVPKTSSFSDDESEEEEDEVDGEKRAVEHRWFWILRAVGTFLQILLMPAIVIGLYVACPKAYCTILDVPRFPQRLSSYMNLMSSLVYISFVLLQAILFIIPVGKEVPGFPFGGKSTVLKYRPHNGIFTLLVNIILICTLGYFDVSLNFGCDNFFKLMLTSVIFSFLLSIIMHIKSRWALPHLRNPRGDTGSTLSDFFVGREINPRFGQRFDVKLYAFRFGVSAWAMLLISCLYKSYFTKKYLDIPLLLVAGMQMFYILDTTFREEVYLSSATFTSDGLGYQLIFGAFTVIPCVNIIQAMYLVNHGAKVTAMPHYCSAAIVALFLCGYFISLKSSNIKYEFRRNPYNPKLAHVESIPTSKKKRLIISGWWGIIRHPNYLGDLIMCIAWTLPCGFNHFIPFCPLIFTIILFVVRAVQVDAECRQKYGPAWQCYTEKVRSRIIPYIF